MEYGEVEIVVTAKNLSAFERKFTRGGPRACWLWEGSKSSGRGMFWCGGRSVPASRFSYVAYKGPIERGLVVRHTCDVPLCVNPAHLIVGTKLEDRRDCIERNREARGVVNGQAVLTDQIVSEMRRLYHEDGLSLRELGRRFDVPWTTVRAAVNGHTWTHVGGRVRDKGRVKGGRHHFAQLDEAAVIEMRRLYIVEGGWSFAALGRRFGVHADTARYACIGGTWTHVPFPT